MFAFFLSPLSKMMRSEQPQRCLIHAGMLRIMMLVVVGIFSSVEANTTIPAVSGKNDVKVEEKVFKSSSLLKILYPAGSNNSDIPQCERWAVCNRVDTYSRPWVERLCTCRNSKCSTSIQADDGHTVVDRTRQYKVCETVDRLPTCRYFKDITWTHITSADNKFQQRLHCKCPENSTTYISGRDMRMTSQGMLYYYHFSCSPESTMRCRRKEPCRLFTVRKRYPVEEVTTSTLCSCPPKTTCPAHHTEPFVISDFDSSRPRDGTRTYSGFCGSTEL
ncbi:protein giant-lens [Parasteatoda tepidariorum]|uniref:protein giant-lens n=1 Tax=Parasteatoda tepidariorum TaxID=114398 RepID=UPI00077F9B22|nr:protein giant-lens [Parasteatoda tepidariorum]